MRSARAMSRAATTAEAGRFRATSAARLGPDRAATRSAAIPPASAITSLIRSSVRRSRPLTTDSTSAEGGSTPASVVIVERTWADGTATMTRSLASPMAARSAVARSPSGRSTPGSRASFRPVAAIRAAVSGEWHSRVTGSVRATSLARVVPQAPAPTTATLGAGPISGRAWPWRSCFGGWRACGMETRRQPSCGAAASPTIGPGTPAGSACHRTRTPRAADSRGSGGS